MTDGRPRPPGQQDCKWCVTQSWLCKIAVDEIVRLQETAASASAAYRRLQDGSDDMRRRLHVLSEELRATEEHTIEDAPLHHLQRLLAAVRKATTR